MTRDAIYTPDGIADLVASFLPAELSGHVFDPAAGGGALLSALVRRFGESVTPLALDVDPAAVKSLRQHDGWRVSRADALSSHSRRRSEAWRRARADLGAVVVNPPFSYRGNGGEWADFGSFRGRVSPAVAFIAVLLRDLQAEHGIWAILPDGALDADKHQGFWAEVNKSHDVTRVARFDNRTFPEARVSTCLVQIKRRTEFAVGPEGLLSPLRTSQSTLCRCVEVIRGRVPVYRLSQNQPSQAVQFLHSTDLGKGYSEPRVAEARLADEAPFVLIVRVGRWSDPLAIDVGRVVLSDCLIALRPRLRSVLPALVASLESAADEFRLEYKGTAAKYLTLQQVCSVLARQGWKPFVTKAGAVIARCDCENRSQVLRAGLQ